MPTCPACGEAWTPDERPDKFGWIFMLVFGAAMTALYLGIPMLDLLYWVFGWGGNVDSELVIFFGAIGALGVMSLVTLYLRGYRTSSSCH